ncbi:carbohydrate esterase family 4 protein [Babjeviella inositovora NRRL Y-12698]|uniref:chitin deacetylase n=1 Tax=Babjeviella inositovora NRRL Y-12698 TaxID=984486 RepID=A0A1E3QNJ2_9ASCO|nr:carbohydrate esterase family 4 protein [Babjeviella inositovora NRRL Y-12698]ODQ79208.1 carbohydrate esterase family 4 protein [Babjeviella inositovora NRRL Y-12698]
MKPFTYLASGILSGTALGYTLPVEVNTMNHQKADERPPESPQAFESLNIHNQDGDKSPVGFNPVLQAQQPFPVWLTEVTGLTEWPGLDPPYIPLDFIDMNAIPKFPAHDFGVCPPVRDSCSFDCYKCVAFDDVYTCPKLSQTFDDGPSPATPKLLDHLQNPSTFFTLGTNVVRFPDVYLQIMAKGHVMASHTWGHRFLPALSNEDIIAQIQWSVWAMNATGNHLPKWFRPPYGGTDDRVRYIVRQFGMQSVLWDLDSFDWQLVSNERTETEIYGDARAWVAKRPKSGLILEHDGLIRTVNAAIEVNKIIGRDQLTVPQCVGGINYIKEFKKSWWRTPW